MLDNEQLSINQLLDKYNELHQQFSELNEKYTALDEKYTNVNEKYSTFMAQEEEKNINFEKKRQDLLEREKRINKIIIEIFIDFFMRKCSF